MTETQLILFICVPLLALTALLNIILIMLLVSYLKSSQNKETDKELAVISEKLDDLEDEENETRAIFDRALSSSKRETVSSLTDFLKVFSDNLTSSQREAAERNDRSTEKYAAAVGDSVGRLGKSVEFTVTTLDDRFAKLSESVAKMSADIRNEVDAQMKTMRAENEKALAEIRATVDEKLQQTLEDRISKSFRDVSERLEQVYKGLGEMQTLAAGVGDLKKVLSNVKTRGTLGEIQLGAILEQILTPEQYSANVMPVPGSKKIVEYAVRMPGNGDGGQIWLPIDSKFPTDAYYDLNEACDSGDKEKIDACGAVFERRIKEFAKEISEKYICTPYTTDFAIMFLPTEGIYAETVKRGLTEELQKMKIAVTGPTTMAALLNSLQMGFRTLAIQKRSGEVWETLGAVKAEFSKFEDVLAGIQTRLEKANKDLDQLVTTRTKAIQRKLRDVSILAPGEAERIINDDE